MSRPKSIENYLTFLNKPIKDDNTMLFFITYIEPKTKKTVRFEHKDKKIVVARYKQLVKRFKKINTKRNKDVKTDTIIKPENKLDGKFTDKINNKLVIEEIQTTALELKVDGLQQYEIVEKLIALYQIPKDQAYRAALWAYEELAKDVDDEFIRLTIFNHGYAYDDLYKKFIDLSSPKLAINALKAKETLNGIGNDIFEIQINNVFEASEELISYGMNQLTNSEQQELISILNKLGRSETGVKQIEASNPS